MRKAGRSMISRPKRAFAIEVILRGAHVVAVPGPVPHAVLGADAAIRPIELVQEPLERLRVGEVRVEKAPPAEMRYELRV